MHVTAFSQLVRQWVRPVSLEAEVEMPLNVLLVTDRLWHLIVTAEVLLRTPHDTYRGPYLDTTTARLYLEALEAALAADVLTAGDVVALRAALSDWPSESTLVRELVGAIVSDLNVLRFAPGALEEGGRIMRRHRGDSS